MADTADLGFVIGLRNVAKFFADIGMVRSKVSKAMRDGQSETEKLGNEFKKLPNNLAKVSQSIDSTFAVQKLQQFTGTLKRLAVSSLNLADQQARAEAKVAQAIKSTGNAANRSFDQLKANASELQQQTLFGDEDILNNVTAQLQTFTNVTNTEFDRAQKVVLDLATVLDADLKSTAIQVGKALNDLSGKGVTALQRSGIQFTETQKELIKSLFDTGRAAEAQGIILAELERQYGGQAGAAAAASDGIQQFKNELGDLGEEIGQTLRPILRELLGRLRGLLEWVRENKRLVIALAAGIGTLAGGMTVLTTATKLLTAAASSNPIGLLVSAAVAGAAALAAFNAVAEDTKMQFIGISQASGEAVRNLDDIAKLLSKIRAGSETGAEKLKQLEKDLADVNAQIATTNKLAKEGADIDVDLAEVGGQFAASIGRSNVQFQKNAQATAADLQAQKKQIEDAIAKIKEARKEYAAAIAPDFIAKSIADYQKQLAVLTEKQTKFTVAGTKQYNELGKEIRDVTREIQLLQGAIFEIDTKGGADAARTFARAQRDAAREFESDSLALPTRDTIPGLIDPLAELPEKISPIKTVLREIADEFKRLGDQIEEVAVGAFAAFAEGIGQAIAGAGSFQEVLIRLAQDLIPVILRTGGLFLLQQAVQTPGPVGVGLFAAGLALLVASGIASGLLSRAAEATGAAGAASSVPDNTQAAPGLSSFGGTDETNLQVIVILNDERVDDALERTRTRREELRGR